MQPVLTPAQGQTPVIQRHLVLQVQAGVVGFLVVIVVGGVVDVAEVLPVDRVDDVTDRGRAVLPFVMGIDALMIEADQQRVLERTGGEVGLQVVVDGELADVFVHDVGPALDGAVIGHRTKVTAGGDALKGQVTFGVTQVLAELPHIVQAMFKGIAECVVSFVVELPVRITQVLVGLDLACRGGHQRALNRQELAGGAGVIAVELAEEGQCGVRVDVPRQARGDVVALVIGVFDGGVAVTHHAAHAIQKTPFVIYRPGAVKADLLALVTADLQLYFVAGGVFGATADHVQQAACRGLPVHR